MEERRPRYADAIYDEREMERWDRLVDGFVAHGRTAAQAMQQADHVLFGRRRRTRCVKMVRLSTTLPGVAAQGSDLRCKFPAGHTGKCE